MELATVAPAIVVANRLATPSAATTDVAAESLVVVTRDGLPVTTVEPTAVEHVAAAFSVVDWEAVRPQVPATIAVPTAAEAVAVADCLVAEWAAERPQVIATIAEPIQSEMDEPESSVVDLPPALERAIHAEPTAVETAVVAIYSVAEAVFVEPVEWAGRAQPAEPTAADAVAGFADDSPVEAVVTTAAVSADDCAANAPVEVPSTLTARFLTRQAR